MSTQDLEGLWDGSERVFLALKLKGNISLEAGGLHDPGNTGIVEIEGIPASAAKVGFALHQDRPVCQLRQSLVGIFKEITGVQRDFCLLYTSDAADE